MASKDLAPGSLQLSCLGSGLICGLVYTAAFSSSSVFKFAFRWRHSPPDPQSLGNHAGRLGVSRQMRRLRWQVPVCILMQSKKEDFIIRFTTQSSSEHPSACSLCGCQPGLGLKTCFCSREAGDICWLPFRASGGFSSPPQSCRSF